MSKPVILVLGSSSMVGKATVMRLSSKFADQVAIKAGTRDPAKLSELARLKGVELVRADLRLATLADQIKSTGAATVFSVTPGEENRADIALRTFRACKEAGVKHMVVVSVLTADMQETIFGRQFTEIEAHVKQLGIPYTLLRLPVFMENNRAYKKTIKVQSAVCSPVNPDAYFTPIAACDVGKVSAAILVNPELYVNKTLKAAAMPHNHRDLVQAFTESLGREIKFVKLSYPAAKEAFVSDGYPEWQVDGILELFKLIDAGSSVTNDLEGVTQFKAVTGSDPVTIHQWVRARCW